MPLLQNFILNIVFFFLFFSGEELELRLYTELNPGLPTEELLSYTEMWNSDPHITGLPQISCSI